VSQCNVMNHDQIVTNTAAKVISLKKHARHSTCDKINLKSTNDLYWKCNDQKLITRSFLYLRSHLLCGSVEACNQKSVAKSTTVAFKEEHWVEGMYDSKRVDQVRGLNTCTQNMYLLYPYRRYLARKVGSSHIYCHVSGVP
jgi:hypothetical protein